MFQKKGFTMDSNINNLRIKDIIKEFNLSKKKVEEVIKTIRGDNMSDSKNAEEKYEVLQKYGRDLVDFVDKNLDLQFNNSSNIVAVRSDFLEGILTKEIKDFFN